MNEVLIYLMLSPLSIAGYAALARRVQQSGGRVATAHLGPPDVVLASLISTLFALWGWLQFTLSTSGIPVRAITTRDIWEGAAPQFIFVFGITLFLWTRRISLVETLGLNRVTPLVLLGASIGLVVLAYPGLVLVSILHGNSGTSGEQQVVTFFREQVRLNHRYAIASLMITAAIVAPVVEEFIFRGYLYPVFKGFSGSKLAGAVFTSALFAAVHGNLASMLPLFALALCLTLAFEWSGSLLVSMGMHATFNSIELLMIYQSAMKPHP